MNKSREIQKQYIDLKGKVEDRIHHLESRLSASPSQNYIKIVQPNHSFVQQESRIYHNTCHHHHHCHPCHHCHPHPSQPPYNSYRVGDMCNSQLQITSHINLPSKSTINNDYINEILAENLKNQKQINGNIKAINEHIETLSMQHNPSNMSEPFSEGVVKHNKRQIEQCAFYQEEDKPRCRSEMKQQLRSELPEIGQMEKATVKKTKAGVKKTDSSSMKNRLCHTKIKGKKGKLKSLSVAKSSTDYFLSFGCPIHPANKNSSNHSQMKQIYKDSEYRNRKHEKGHLLNSFDQQQRSRKQLLSRIVRQVFGEYGK